MGSNSVPSASRSVRSVSRRTQARRATPDFQCPDEDTQGNHLSTQSSTNNNNGSIHQQITVCGYEDQTDTCVYTNGSFTLGPSSCPGFTSPTTSPPPTTTATSIVTKTVPPSTTSSSTDTPVPSTTSSTLVPSTSATSASSTVLTSSLPSSSTSAPYSPISGSSSASDFSSTETTSAAAAQSATSSSTNSPAVGQIVGIAVGAVAALLLGIILCLWIGKTGHRRRQSVDLEPESYIAAAPGDGTVPAGEKFWRSARVFSPRSRSTPASTETAQNRQEYLTAQLRALQKQLDSLQSGVGPGSANLEQAMQQNEALRARITALERELQSRWSGGVSEPWHPPPGYTLD
ncbi:hypothetical protein FB451DRAFT_774855 [Mycena latifolia]|nr:hypothetical protein FB451DRAFT_774855 [Mycena latifolia]